MYKNSGKDWTCGKYKDRCCETCMRREKEESTKQELTTNRPQTSSKAPPATTPKTTTTATTPPTTTTTTTTTITTSTTTKAKSVCRDGLLVGRPGRQYSACPYIQLTRRFRNSRRWFCWMCCATCKRRGIQG